MHISRYFLLPLSIAFIFASFCLTAQEKTAKVIPKVLVIGDSVYNQALEATKELKEEAAVTFAKWPAEVMPNSTNAIEQIDLLLGLKDAKGIDIPKDKIPTWNIIFINVGLGDLIYHAPGLKSHRSMSYDAGGVVTTTVTDYEKNLDKLIPLIRQKAPQAKLVWLSTTPILQSNYKWFKPGSEVEYNQAAKRVMNKNKVLINDMHAQLIQTLPANVKPDPFGFKSKELTPILVKNIRQELK